jgi:hypothetical protein
LQENAKKLAEAIILLHDSAHPHMKNLMMMLASLGWEILNYPP